MQYMPFCTYSQPDLVQEAADVYLTKHPNQFPEYLGLHRIHAMELAFQHHSKMKFLFILHIITHCTIL
jgi:hypothetical protein